MKICCSGLCPSYHPPPLQRKLPTSTASKYSNVSLHSPTMILIVRGMLQPTGIATTLTTPITSHRLSFTAMQVRSVQCLCEPKIMKLWQARSPNLFGEQHRSLGAAKHATPMGRQALYQTPQFFGTKGPLNIAPTRDPILIPSVRPLWCDICLRRHLFITFTRLTCSTHILLSMSHIL